jgi:hypothetical protein
MRRIFILLAAVSFLICICAFAQSNSAPLPPIAQKMYTLFDNLRKKGPVSFQLADSEINDYMKYSLKAVPRPGLDSVTVKVFPNNYVSTFSIVDFDAVERWKPGTIPMLMRPVLSGKKSIWVDFRFRATGGTASFSIEKAYFQQIRLPALLVEKVIQVVAARQPEHYDTSKPVPIPFELKTVWTNGNVIHGQR